MSRPIPKLAAEAAPIVMLAGAGVMALRGAHAREDLPSPRAGALRPPRRFTRKDWTEILQRTRAEFVRDRVSLVAAGVAFFVLLSLFPGLGVVVSLYGLFADVQRAQAHLHALTAVLPPPAVKLVGQQMLRLAALRGGGLSFALLLGVITSLWTANGAVNALISGLNIAYEERERRGFLRRRLISLAFTLGLLAFGIAAIFGLGAGAALEPYLGPHSALLIELATWFVLLLGMVLGLALLYRFGPSRERIRFQWLSWGSGLAVLLWVAMSVLFSIYVGNFSHYDRTYGSLGAAVGFMIWSWLSCLVVLMGAELNSEVERQMALPPGGAERRRDSTAAPD